MPNSIYIDVSAYQGQINWTEYVSWAKAQGYTPMAAIKATEGVGFVDACFERNRQDALQAGVEKLFYYSYARPDKGNSAQAEADFLHRIVGSIREQDALMLDMEIVPPAHWVNEWISQQEINYSPQQVVVYSYDAFIRAHLQDEWLSHYGLIMANYTYDATARPACPPPWKRYIALQYTDKANIPGITGPVDANVWLGSEEENIVIDINTPGISEHFTQIDEQHWQSKSTGKIIQYGMLANYKQEGNKGLCGWEELGDPMSNEIELGAPYAQGSVKQYYRFGVRLWDASTGKVTPLDLYDGPGQDPMITTLNQQIATLEAKLAVVGNNQDAAKLAQIKLIVNS